MYLVVHETENENGVREIETKKRNCNFPREGNAGYYSHYSYSACIVGCRRRAEMALCNCTRHLLPYTGKVTPIAGFSLSWRYNPHWGVVFYSPLAGFSLLACEVS